MKGSLKAKVRIGPEHHHHHLARRHRLGAGVEDHCYHHCQRHHHRHHHHLARRHRLGAGVEEDAATFGSIKVGELGAVGPLETGGLEEDCYYFYHYHYLETCRPEGDHYAALC